MTYETVRNVHGPTGEGVRTPEPGLPGALSPLLQDNVFALGYRLARVALETVPSSEYK
jgi:hypothetical protein